MDPAPEPSPLPSPPVAAPPVVPRPVAALSYSTNEYDRARDVSSLDREMTARLCRTFGVCLVLLGLALVLLMCPMACQSTAGGAAISLLVPIFVFLAPGLILLSCVEPIREVKKPAAIIVLLVGLFLAFMLGMMLLGIALASLSPMNPTPAVSLAMQGVMVLLPLGGTVKLLYHDIRLLAAPGRGATRDVIIDVGELLAAGPGGLPADDVTVVRRVGVLRIVTGSLMAIVGGVLLWMSVTQVPVTPPRPSAAPPPPPPISLSAFELDMRDVDGLAAPDRELVAAHISAGVEMSEAQRQMLDDGLREIGGVMIDQAGWRSRRDSGLPRAPSGRPPARPLRQADVVGRLPALAPPVQNGGITLYRGGWHLRWAQDGSFTVEADQLLRSTRETHTPIRLRGDVVVRRRRLVHWSHGAMARFFENLQKRGAWPESGKGTPHTITAPQGKAIAMLIIAEQPDAKPDAMTLPQLPFSAVMRPDGVVEFTGPKGVSWIDERGEKQATSPEDRAAQAASAAAAALATARANSPRRLAGSPWAAAVVMLCALTCVVFAVRILKPGNADQVNTSRTLAWLMVFSAIGLIAAVWFVVHVLLNEPEGRRWVFDPTFVIGTLFALVLAAWSGFWMPALARRRLAARTAQLNQ